MGIGVLYVDYFSSLLVHDDNVKKKKYFYLVGFQYNKSHFVSLLCTAINDLILPNTIGNIFNILLPISIIVLHNLNWKVSS